MYLGGETARNFGGSGVVELYRTTLQRQNSDTGVEAAVKQGTAVVLRLRYLYRRPLQRYGVSASCTVGHYSCTGMPVAVQSGTIEVLG